jgi:hypothetical protein
MRTKDRTAGNNGGDSGWQSYDLGEFMRTQGVQHRLNKEKSVDHLNNGIH